MLQEAKDLQNSAVSKLVNVVGQKEKSEYTFKSPTGSGKTYMMADFMNRIICANPDVIFLVSTLSKSSLAEQNYKSFKALSENGTFSRLNPFLINSDSSGEGNIFIPLDYNVYVLPRDLYKDKSKLKDTGIFKNFLLSIKGSFSSPQKKRIFVIKDECHIATSNLDELKDCFSVVINFSATPKLSRSQTPDVEITNEEAENAKLIKTVEQGSETDTLENALDKFEKVKGEYTNLLSVNPCFIVQISNKDKAEEELEKNIFPTLQKEKFQNLKWVYISGKEKECDTNDSGLKKLSVSKWKDYMKEKTSSISVIIFKMVISEGWDIPRACMLYQIRDSKSKQLDEQVMGRVRRNPHLLDFETLSKEARKLACTSWIWGIMPKTENAARNVNLYSGYNIENEIRITPTKLKSINEAKDFDFESYIKNLKDDKITHKSIFEMYQDLQKCSGDIQKMCYEYAKNYSAWRIFAENLGSIKTKCSEYILDYSKSMYACGNVSFPTFSCYNESGRTITLDDWVWRRKDNESDFSFDSEAERKWAELLKDIRSASIQQTSSELFGNKFLWGKNFPFNSEIKFEYYLDGNIHSSYPDFVMKDKKGRIHIFEVKSVNKSAQLNIDEAEYAKKVNALISCYLECSRKTNHIFYLPVLDKSQWQITVLKNGEKSTIGEEQLKRALTEGL